MSQYEQLVEALRETATFTKFDDLLSKREQKLESLAFDAAAAIEALQAEVKDAFNEGYNAGYTAGIGYCSFKRAKMEVQDG